MLFVAAATSALRYFCQRILLSQCGVLYLVVAYSIRRIAFGDSFYSIWSNINICFCGNLKTKVGKYKEYNYIKLTCRIFNMSVVAWKSYSNEKCICPTFSEGSELSMYISTNDIERFCRKAI